MVHVINLREGSLHVKGVSKQRAHSCMLIMEELQNIWPVMMWVQRLFVYLLDQGTGNITAEMQASRPNVCLTTPAMRPNNLSNDTILSHSSAVDEFYPSFRTGVSDGEYHSMDDVYLMRSMLPFSSLLEDAGLDLGGNLLDLDNL